MEWYSVKASDVTKRYYNFRFDFFHLGIFEEKINFIRRAFEGARKEGGLVIDANTTALDIGCNTGGMLDVVSQKPLKK